MSPSITAVRQNRGLALFTGAVALLGGVAYLWLNRSRFTQVSEPLEHVAPVQKRSASDIDVPPAP